MMFKSVKCILWDWNGTLLNDVDVNLKVVNQMLIDRDLPAGVSRTYYRDNFTFPVFNFYVKVGFQFESEDFNQAAADYVRWYTTFLPEAALHKGATDVIAQLNTLGYNQYILSATQRDNLVKQVGFFGLTSPFKDMLGVSDSRGDGKVTMAQNWISQSGYIPDEIVMIGDTDHDCEVANAIGCKCILIANGHQSRHVLERTNAVIVDDISEVLDKLKK